mmetsp:Transcript_41578/g.105812  ORF Transcript_41578/g.105812 Transcript_41578/m.105812 type:complete len:281 (+) Transcript_41578:252-1094(+)
MVSQVVRLDMARYEWKHKRMDTIINSSDMINNPNTSNGDLFIHAETSQPLTLTKCIQPSLLNTASSMDCAAKYHQKQTRLPSATQVPTQGQWWSWVRTHRPQSLQCFVRNGCWIWQCLQYRSCSSERTPPLKTCTDRDRARPAPPLAVPASRAAAPELSQRLASRGKPSPISKTRLMLESRPPDSKSCGLITSSPGSSSSSSSNLPNVMGCSSLARASTEPAAAPIGAPCSHRSPPSARQQNASTTATTFTTQQTTVSGRGGFTSSEAFKKPGGLSTVQR